MAPRVSTKRQGFTLLELLLVVTIIGVMSAVSISGFRAASDRARVNQAAAQLSADLQRARSASQRYNREARFITDTATANSYELVINGDTLERTLPAGAQLSADNALNIRYSAPFGEIGDAVPSRIKVDLANRSAKPLYVKVLGVTGKVVLSAVQ